MGITRLIIIIGIIWLVWFFYKRFQQKIAERDRTASEKENQVSSVKKCAVCGVHVPEAEALEDNGLYFCCAAHKNKKQ